MPDTDATVRTLTDEEIHDLFVKDDPVRDFHQSAIAYHDNSTPETKAWLDKAEAALRARLAPPTQSWVKETCADCRNQFVLTPFRCVTCSSERLNALELRTARQTAADATARAAVIAAMTPQWFPMETLVHEHVDDKPMMVEGKIVPATYTSDPVILTNGKRVWVERSVIIGGARSSSADKFTAYPSGDKPTHWQPLPAAPEAP